MHSIWNSQKQAEATFDDRRGILYKNPRIPSKCLADSSPIEPSKASEGEIMINKINKIGVNNISNVSSKKLFQGTVEYTFKSKVLLHGYVLSVGLAIALFFRLFISYWKTQVHLVLTINLHIFPKLWAFLKARMANCDPRFSNCH